VLDPQSAKSAEGGEAIGYDAGTRVRGRKRHVLVGTGGLVLHRLVQADDRPATTNARPPTPRPSSTWP
jgi:hypothetical protein